MTEITRVPLQPIAKGALTKLWIGVAAAALAAGGLAWAAMPAGVKVTTITAGTGATPLKDDVVFIKYVGKLAADGKEFDRSPDKPISPIPGLLPEGVPMALDGVVPGFAEGLLKMQKGGKYTLFIPAEKVYGATPPQGAPIPPNADLVFDVQLVDFMPRADAERRFQMIQAMMEQAQRQQQGKGGRGARGPGGPGGPGGEPPLPEGVLPAGPPQ